MMIVLLVAMVVCHRGGQDDAGFLIESNGGTNHKTIDHHKANQAALIHWLISESCVHTPAHSTWP